MLPSYYYKWGAGRAVFSSSVRVLCTHKLTHAASHREPARHPLAGQREGHRPRFAVACIIGMVAGVLPTNTTPDISLTSTASAAAHENEAHEGDRRRVFSNVQVVKLVESLNNT